MKRFLSILLALIMAFICMPFTEVSADSGLITKKFDFGNAGVESGYIGVSSKDVYSKSKGYGFAKSDTAVDVAISGGKGVLKDACHFDTDTDHRFYVDLPNGVYKITVTTGDDVGSTISANGYQQLFFLKGKNATDSFTIPIADGKLAIYPTKGNQEGSHSLCSLEIEQVESLKPTIWVFGDSTVANYYNISDNDAHGWGQALGDFVDTDKYQIRNFAISGMDAPTLDANKGILPTAEAYGQSGDIALVALGINDSINKNISSNQYVTAMTSIVRRLKAKGMTVYLVKQQGVRDDVLSSTLPDKMWYSDEIDSIAKSENVGIIDLFHPWLSFCLNHKSNVKDYYKYDNDLHPNLKGSIVLAEMVANQLFPTSNPTPTTAVPTRAPSGTLPDTDYGEFTAKNLRITYETEVSGGPVKNPHKGFVMTVYNSDAFRSTNAYGIGGSKDNHAWDVVTIVSGAPYWNELNPAEGVYNWAIIDDVLDACEEYGMTYGIRIIPYSTSVGSDSNYGKDHDLVPSYVYENGAKHTIATYKWVDSSPKIKIPDWSDPVYIQACKDFAKALADKYDGDPRIEFIDIRPFGNWGEWHTSEFNGSSMPSEAIQMDMLDYYTSVFKNTTLAVPSDVTGAVYEHALALGISKRNDGLILDPNAEEDLIPTYNANLPVIGENHNTYEFMKNMPVNNSEHYIPWTPDRFREVIETSHLSIYALDQDSNCSYQFYKEQQSVIDEMCNRLGYNFTVTSAVLYDNTLVVKIKNTGLASCFFDIQLCAELTDDNGNKLSNLGEPVLIPDGSFRDGMERTFIFEYNGTLASDATICLAMYDINNPLVAGKNPTVKFDNKNTLSNNRLKLVEVSREVINSTNTSPSPTVTQTPGSTATPGNTITPGTTTTVPTSGAVPTSGTNNPTNGPVPTSSTIIGEVPTDSINPTGTPSAGGNTSFPEPTLNVGDFVTRCYNVALDREPDSIGYEYWVDNLNNGGACGAQVGYGFIFSAEYIGKNRSNENYIGDLYAMYFDRAPDSEGFNYWLNKLNSGESRESVFAGFANSLEFYNLCTNYGVTQGLYLEGVDNTQQGGINCFVARLYNVCLNRLPDMGGQAGWVQKLYDGDVTGATCSYGFVFSPEFIGKGLTNEEFVNCMYKAFFGREADSEGFNSWVNTLNNGGSYEEVFNGFTGSLEFHVLCAAYGINP